MLELAHNARCGTPESSPLAEARERRDLSIKQVALQERSQRGRDRVAGGGSHLPLPIAERRDARGRRLRDCARGSTASRPAASPGYRGATESFRVNARARLIVVGAARRAPVGARRHGARSELEPQPRHAHRRGRSPNANLAPPWKLHDHGRERRWRHQLDARSSQAASARWATRSTKVGAPTASTTRQTTVYYGPGGEDVGVRLARQLSVRSEESTGDSDGSCS